MRMEFVEGVWREREVELKVGDARESFRMGGAGGQV